LSPAAAFPQLIFRNVGLAVAGNCTQGCHPAVAAPASTGERTKPTVEERMTAAEQAFLFTGELFVLSFAAIFAVWFADKLRRNFSGKP
jgi:hypothetical protein